jgi:hypothetical protein
VLLLRGHLFEKENIYPRFEVSFAVTAKCFVFRDVATLSSVETYPALGGM